MSGRILIVEPIATNRILIRSMLTAASYEVSCAASLPELRERVATFQPDVILMNFGPRLMPALACCEKLTGAVGPGLPAPRIRTGALNPRPNADGIPIIALVQDASSAARLAILRSGAADIFEKPANASRLLARIRSLLRARDEDAEFLPKVGTAGLFSFAEEGSSFAAPARVSILTHRPERLDPVRQRLSERKLRCQIHGSATDVPSFNPGFAPDLFIIDAPGGGVGSGDLFRLLSDLRSRSVTRHAAQLVILPQDAHDLAVMALDLGANDLVSEAISSAELHHRIDTLLQQKAASDKLRNSVRSGLEAALTDPLTGLFNRRFALSQTADTAKSASRTKSTFAALMLDIDHFKAINDTYGHAIGDQVLIGVARRLQKEVRSQDFVARIGGEEFLVVLRDSTMQEASQMAERLRMAIGNQSFEVIKDQSTLAPAGPELHVTLSVGVAMGGGECQSEVGIEALYARADAALYAAKTAGRNQVTLSSTAA